MTAVRTSAGRAAARRTPAWIGGFRIDPVQPGRCLHHVGAHLKFTTPDSPCTSLGRTDALLHAQDIGQQALIFGTATWINIISCAHARGRTILLPYLEYAQQGRVWFGSSCNSVYRAVEGTQSAIRLIRCVARSVQKASAGRL